MLRRYEKTDAPSWQHKLILLIGAFFGATLLLFAAWAIVLFLDRSRAGCLDESGGYTETADDCVPADERDAYEPYDGSGSGYGDSSL